MTDSRDIGTHCLSEHNRKVTESYKLKLYFAEHTSDTNNRHLLSRSTFMSLHGRVNGQSSAKHGGNEITRNRFRNRECKSLVSPDVASISTPSFVAIRIICIVGIDLLGAIIFVVAFALSSTKYWTSIRYDIQDKTKFVHQHQHDRQL